MRQGPYFNNVPYISPLPAGYMEAATSGGRAMAAGISSMGDSIAGAIKQYGQNKEERDFLDQKFEMAAPTLEKYKDIAKDDPRLQKLVDGLGKFSSMSNTQKKAYLNNAEFAIAQVDKEQLQKYQREQDAMKMDLAKQQALFEGARLANDTARTNAEIKRMQETFRPSGSMVDVPGMGRVPMVMTSPNSAQIVPTAKPQQPDSPLAQLMADRDLLAARGDKEGAATIQRKIDAETNKVQPKLEQSEKTFMANAQEYLAQLNELESVVKSHGNFEMGFGTDAGINASAKLSSLPYKMAITYSKIVDPQSVAREGEVEMTKENVIPMGFGVSNDKTLAAIKNQRDEIKRRIEQFNALNAEKLEGKQTPKDTAAPTPKVEIKKDTLGRSYEVRRLK